MKRLLLARHGESEYSVRGLLNGDSSIDVGLTAVGEKQARRLGGLLARQPLDLCVVSELGRTRATADLALAGRGVPLEVWPEFNDPRAGRFEGLHLDEYRGWAWSAGSGEDAPGGGESRLAAISRFVRAYRALCERPEPAILAVVHALPIAYVLQALDGEPPLPRMDRPIEYARPYTLHRDELARALALLEAWSSQPTW